MKADLLPDFLGLSRLLTGVEDLDESLGRQYLDRLRGTPYDPTVRKSIEIFGTIRGSPGVRDHVRDEILGDDSLRPAIIQIVLLWYTSAMQDNPASSPAQLRYGTQGEFFSGLGWRIIGAHVPGLSGGYFGHWRYRPDNEPKKNAT